MEVMTCNSFKPHLIRQDTLDTLSLDSLLKVVTSRKLVIIRGLAAITRDDLLDFCQSQARLLSWDFGPVMEMKVEEEAKNYLFTSGDVPLHWDGAFYQEPRFLLFNCLQAPAFGTGGETLFVNTEMVWQNSDEALKQKWRYYTLTYQTEKLAHYGGAITRPMVNNHPDTGNVILRFAEPVGEDYLNPVQVRVQGKSDNESTAILQEISCLMRQPRFIYQHQWLPGDVLIADNFSLLHGRNAFHQHSARHLRRIQIL